MRDRHVFMWQSLEVWNVFNTLTLKSIFLKTKIFFKKLDYHFSVESTRIENATLPYKTALSEANVKTNRMGGTIWTYHKDRSFAITLVFRKSSFSLRTSYKELIWCTNHPNVHIHTFRKRWNFIWERFFSLSILRNNQCGKEDTEK